MLATPKNQKFDKFTAFGLNFSGKLFLAGETLGLFGVSLGANSANKYTTQYMYSPSAKIGTGVLLAGFFELVFAFFVMVLRGHLFECHTVECARSSVRLTDDYIAGSIAIVEVFAYSLRGDKFLK